MTSSEALLPRILVADRPAVRLGVRIALKGAAQVCAEAGDAEEAIRLAECEQPDISFIGLDLPGDGVVAIRRIHEVVPSGAAIALAPSPDGDRLLACVDAGAVGYLPSSTSADALRRAVAAANDGEAVLPRAMVMVLVRELQRAAPGSDGLTAREAQVVDLLRRGSSTAAIADRLGISSVTVRRHISASMNKLGAKNRAALA